MQPTPYVHFNGNCEEAFAFYAKILDGKINTMMRWRDMPGGNVPPGMENKVMHGHLALDGGALLASDAPPANYAKPQGFNINIAAPNAAEAERIFAAFSDGGEVRMPITQTFFAERFGMVTDRFGIPWQVMTQG